MKKYTRILLAASVFSSSLIAMEAVKLTPDEIREYFANTSGGYDIEYVKEALLGVGCACPDLHDFALNVVKKSLKPHIGAEDAHFYYVEAIDLAKKLRSTNVDVQHMLADVVRDALDHPAVGANGRNYYQQPIVELALDRGADGVGAAHTDLYYKARAIFLNELTNPGTCAHDRYFSPLYIEMAKTQLDDAEINAAFMNAIGEILDNPKMFDTPDIASGPISFYQSILAYVRNNQVLFPQNILDKVATIN